MTDPTIPLSDRVAGCLAQAAILLWVCAVCAGACRPIIERGAKLVAKHGAQHAQHR